MALHRPHSRRRLQGRPEAVTSGGAGTIVRPLGAAGVGVLAALLGAWGALSVFVGPEFGYRPTTSGSWVWVSQNWLLHLVPGAAALAAGLMVSILSLRRVGSGGPLAMSALILISAGAWFVIGPALWPTFESAPAFALGTSSGTSFVNQVGSALGPGVLLAVFGGMALKAGIARPRVAPAESTDPAFDRTAVSGRAVSQRDAPADAVAPNS